MVVLALLTAAPGAAMAERNSAQPWAPSALLARRTELQLSAHQVGQLQLLAEQVRRHEQAVIMAPSKPWIANSHGITAPAAAQKARGLLTSEQQRLVTAQG